MCRDKKNSGTLSGYTSGTTRTRNNGLCMSILVSGFHITPLGLLWLYGSSHNRGANGMALFLLPSWLINQGLKLRLEDSGIELRDIRGYDLGHNTLLL